ncbi:hypothetical protein GCM10010406_08760 [Streptomyces thermolineatus]|uniref:Transketolase n=1 Tax=Streptomyces thermolineatus TaxID=44033 RepID=A0ABN3L206_9ACTN
MSGLLRRCEERATAVLPTLPPHERAVVEAELAALRTVADTGTGTDTATGTGTRPAPADPLTELRALARAVPERLYRDSAQVLRRMHEIAGSGNLESCLSSLGIVRACFDLGLVPAGRADAPAGQGDPVLVVGRGHIAPAFYAEHYVRGQFPFLPLTALHHGLTGVVHRDLGFSHTMRYSLGVGVAQAVSRAWELTRRGSDAKVVCLAGDGELQEGSTFEALRFAHDADLRNLVLVVDANGKGIEPLAKPLNRDYLAAYARELTEVGGTAPEVGDALAKLLEDEGPAVLVCRTRKGAHSFKPPAAPGAPPAKASFATTAGAALSAHLAETGRSAAVFTADMAARFGLAAGPPYTNVGLAETIGVGLTLSLPEDTLKVVATDAMYYMDSLSMLTEATTGVRNLLLLAGRNWAAWGGAHNAFNLLGLVLGARVYEPVTSAELDACLRHQHARPETAHVVSMVDARYDQPDWGCERDVDGAVWVVPPGPDRRRAVVTFGYAGVLVDAVNRDGEVAHLHCAALDPRLTAAQVAALRSFDRLLTVEYNGVQGGFGERLRARHLLDATVHGVRGDIATLVHDRQLAVHGMDPASLRELLTGGDRTGEVAACAGARA